MDICEIVLIVELMESSRTPTNDPTSFSVEAPVTRRSLVQLPTFAARGLEKRRATIGGADVSDASCTHPSSVDRRCGRVAGSGEVYRGRKVGRAGEVARGGIVLDYLRARCLSLPLRIHDALSCARLLNALAAFGNRCSTQSTTTHTIHPLGVLALHAQVHAHSRWDGESKGFQR